MTGLFEHYIADTLTKLVMSTYFCSFEEKIQAGILILWHWTIGLYLKRWWCWFCLFFPAVVIVFERLRSLCITQQCELCCLQQLNCSWTLTLQIS